MYYDEWEDEDTEALKNINRKEFVEKVVDRFYKNNSNRLGHDAHAVKISLTDTMMHFLKKEGWVKN